MSASAKQLQGVFGKVTPFEDAQRDQSFPGCRTTERWGLEGTFRGHLVPLPEQHGAIYHTGGAVAIAERPP